MNSYARVVREQVVELIETDGDISSMFHPDLKWVACDETVCVGDIWDGQVFTRPHVLTSPLTDRRTSLVRCIDADVDAIYAAVVGNRGAEYAQAEAEALTYKDSGYEGAAPASVAVWANAKGWSDREAADDILATAATWRQASASIRAARLVSKERARRAEDDVALDACARDWEAWVSGMRSQLGVA